MSLSIHLHRLHLGAQYGQTWHLSTQLRSRETTGSRLLWSTTLLLPTVLSDSQVLISFVIQGDFRTGQGLHRANLHKCRLAKSHSCDGGQRETMNHIVHTCPLTKCEGGLNHLNLLHGADDDTVIWLESTATAALAKWNKNLSYRRGTARCVVSIKILPIATQQCRNYLCDKSWPNRWYEVGDLVGGNAW